MASADKEQYCFDFDTIIEDAQKIVVQEGKHPPKAFIEGRERTIETKLIEFPETHEDKLAYMAALGQLVAESGHVGELLQIFVVSSGSLWEADEAIHLEFLDSSKSGAKPVLIVSRVQLEERRKNLVIFEIVHGFENQIVDFLDLLIETDIGIPLETPLEDAFIAGFQGSN